MSPTTILLIDDHALFRSGLSMVLRADIANVQVLEAGSLEEALRNSMNAPDVLLLDIQLQGLNGLDGIELLKRKWPQTPIVMLASDTTQDTMRRALERGAAAFISKAEATSKILAIIKQVLRMETVAEKRVETKTLRLTPRQCEVLDLLCQGLSNKVIGKRLGLSENTVRWHVQALLAFLQVASRSEAAYAARRSGLVN
jgi:DNA-binding NarL/FixJ family response regulator